MATMVTAMVEIHCLRSSEPVLLAKLKTALEEFETVFEPSYIKFQYPSKTTRFLSYVNLHDDVLLLHLLMFLEFLLFLTLLR